MDIDPRLVASLRTLGQAYEPDLVARVAQALSTLGQAERDLTTNPI